MPAHARVLATGLAALTALALTTAAPAKAEPRAPATPMVTATPGASPGPGTQEGGKDVCGLSVSGQPMPDGHRPTVVPFVLTDDATGRPVTNALIVGTLYPAHGQRHVLARVRTDRHGKVVFLVPVGFNGTLRTTWTGDRTHTTSVGRYGQQHTVGTIGTVGATTGGTVGGNR